MRRSLQALAAATALAAALALASIISHAFGRAPAPIGPVAAALAALADRGPPCG